MYTNAYVPVGRTPGQRATLAIMTTLAIVSGLVGGVAVAVWVAADQAAHNADSAGITPWILGTVMCYLLPFGLLRIVLGFVFRK